MLSSIPSLSINLLSLALKRSRLLWQLFLAFCPFWSLWINSPSARWQWFVWLSWAVRCSQCCLACAALYLSDRSVERYFLQDRHPSLQSISQSVCQTVGEGSDAMYEDTWPEMLVICPPRCLQSSIKSASLFPWHTLAPSTKFISCNKQSALCT